MTRGEGLVIVVMLIVGDVTMKEDSSQVQHCCCELFCVS